MRDNLPPELRQCKPDEQAAFEAYAAIAKLAARDEHLARNPYFNALIDTAYARFEAAYVRL